MATTDENKQVLPVVEAPEKRKRGKQTSIKAKKLHAHIRRLNGEIEKLKNVNLLKVEEHSKLTMSAFCVIINEVTKAYELVRVGFDKDNGLGKVMEVTKIAESHVMLTKELMKMVATNVFIQEGKKK